MRHPRVATFEARVSGGVEIAYPELVSIARARIKRAQGPEKQRIQAVVHRLGSAEHRERELAQLAAEITELPRPVARRLLRPFRKPIV